MKIQIKITREVLEKTKMCGIKSNCGENSSAYNCAIAYAVREIMPLGFVSETMIYPFKYGLDAISLPHSARIFIAFFDRLYPEERVLMPGIAFEIEIPDFIIDQIGIEESHAIISKSETLELV